MKRGEFPSADVILLLVVIFFYTIALLCLFSKRRTILCRNRTEMQQDVLWFGLFRKETKKAITGVGIRQAQVMNPYYLVYFAGPEIEEYGQVVKIGLERKSALAKAAELAEFCGVEDLAKDSEYALPPEPEDEKKHLSHLDDEYYHEDDDDLQTDLEDTRNLDS